MVEGEGEPQLRVTAIVLTQNRRDSVLRVLDELGISLFNDVLFVDDGSSDGTADAIRTRFEDVELISLPESQGDAARNLAVTRATGDLFLLVDDDSFPLNGAVE